MSCVVSLKNAAQCRLILSARDSSVLSKAFSLHVAFLQGLYRPDFMYLTLVLVCR